MTIVVATTLHAFATDQQDSSEAWLYNAEAIRDSHDDVRFFAALETDARGLDPFLPLLERMARLVPTTPALGYRMFPEQIHDAIESRRGLGFDYWTFSLDDGAERITSYGDGHPADPGRGGRLRRITTGQNFANTFADSVGATHLLFCAADCAPPPDVLPKLLELDHPICGPEIPTYCLTGPEPVRLPVDPDGVTEPRFPFPVQEHMASAACILLRREVFTRLRWRTDRDAGLTDDPALHHDALALGWPTYVRKDCVAKHYPEAIGAIETRGHDMTVHR